MLNFAWDNLADEGIIKGKIDLLKQVGFTNSMLRAHVQFYVFIDSDKEFDSGLYRCLELRKLSCNSFVMYNIDNERSERIKKLQRWANRKMIYWDDSPESRKQLLELRLMSDGASQILLGDCAETLKTISDESVDLIVTDPPYGYAFMGLNWDRALPSVESLKKCCRVLKAGAFGFFMCAPRQDVLGEMIHLLNRAGFRTDFSSIYWAYAQGF